MKSLCFYFAVACSIVSQVFIALEIGNSDLLKLSWFIPFVFYFLSNAKLFLDRILIPYYIFVLLFVFYCLCCEAVTNVSYMILIIYVYQYLYYLFHTVMVCTYSLLKDLSIIFHSSFLLPV